MVCSGVQLAGVVGVVVLDVPASDRAVAQVTEAVADFKALV